MGSIIVNEPFYNFSLRTSLKEEKITASLVAQFNANSFKVSIKPFSHNFRWYRASIYFVSAL